MAMSFRNWLELNMAQGGGNEAAQVIFRRVPIDSLFDGFMGIESVIAQIDEGVHGVSSDTAQIAGRDGHAGRFPFAFELVSHLNDEALGGFFADARHFA